MHWHSFELDPDAPPRQEVSNSERLAQKYGRSLAEVEDMQRNIAEMAKAEGIDFQWENANSGNTLMPIVWCIWRKVKAWAAKPKKLFL